MQKEIVSAPVRLEMATSLQELLAIDGALSKEGRARATQKDFRLFGQPQLQIMSSTLPDVHCPCMYAGSHLPGQIWVARCPVLATVDAWVNTMGITTCGPTGPASLPGHS